MLLSYLKIAWRNVLAHPMHAAINLLGLSLGIACCVLLALFVRSEWTHDRFHANSDRIVRVNRTAPTASGDRQTYSTTPAPLAGELDRSFPEVERAVRLSSSTVTVQNGERRFEAEATFADSAFFDVFSFDLRQGAPDRALAAPNGLVVTAPAARRYFGTTDVLGRTLTVALDEASVEVEVTGVAQAPPRRSSLQFDVVLPFETIRYNYANQLRSMVLSRWEFPAAATFALLEQPGDRGLLEEKLDAFAARHFQGGDGTASGGESGEAGGGDEVQIHSPDGSEISLSLQPLADIHLTPGIQATAFEPPSDPLYTYLMAAAALLVLAIAGINFTTLALGRSAGRVREVGVRKALGAHRRQVRTQFWGEALLTSGASLVTGLGLAAVFLPTFNRMAGTNLAFQITPTVAVGLVGLAVVVAFLAGSYPALFLSRFDPSAILRGSAQIAGRDRLVRGLLVLQFAVSVSLVGGALVMSNQIDRMQNDLGFRSDQVVRIQNTGGSSGGEPIYGPLRQRAAGLSGVERVGASAFPFFGGAALDAPVALGDTGSVAAQILPVDSTFLPTLGVDIASGRGFSAERPAGRTEVIVNEAFVEAMGWSDPVGREVAFTDASMIGRAMGSVTIIGVAENFHTRSMRHRIQPLVLASAAIVGGSPGVLYARLEGNQIGPTMDALRSAWSAVAPGRTFEYRFLDAVVDETYRAERRWRSVVRYAAGFALAIACFGLFGVAALSVARRRREIGVRKALGASTQSIVALFTKDLLLPMGIAVALALPLTYWGAQQWLRGFAYRIEVGPGLLLAAAGLVLGTALLAVGTQAWRAARVDPALTLREE